MKSTTINELLTEYDTLEKTINSLDDNIHSLRVDLRQKGEVLQKMKLIENSRKEHINLLVPEVQAMLKALNKYPYSDKLICNHFGVHSRADIFSISINVKGKEVMIVLKVRENWVAHSQIGLSKRGWNRIRKLFREKFVITQYWNGGEGHTGISMVLKIVAPKSLVISLKNYSEHTGHGFPKCNFSEHFVKNLKKVKSGVK